MRGPKKPTSLIEDRLKERVVGQPHAIRSVCRYIDIVNSGLCPSGRPAAVMMFLGPTGTGKTHLVESLAEAIHGDSKKVLTIHCGEFQMEHEVAKLVGAPPGYLGHRETKPMLSQQSVNAVKTDKSRFALVLFDEVEKSSKSLAQLLLGILDKATLTLGDSTKVDFSDCLVFFTSNLGASEMSKMSISYTHAAPTVSADEVKRKAESALRAHFSPEFINRIDEYLVFNPLTEGDRMHIAELELMNFAETAAKSWNHPILRWNVHVLRYLAEHGDINTGAREIKRVIRAEIIHPLALLISSLNGNEQVHIRLRDGKLELQRGKAA